MKIFLATSVPTYPRGGIGGEKFAKMAFSVLSASLTILTIYRLKLTGGYSMVFSAKPLSLNPLQRMLEKQKNQPFATFFSHRHTSKIQILRTYIDG